MSRRVYDTSIKHLYRLGCEDSIPLAMRQSIHKANISRWKNEADDKYLGFELNELAKRELEVLQQFAKAKQAKRVFVAALRVGHTLKAIVGEQAIGQAFREHKELVVELADRVKHVFSTERFVNLLGISVSTYQRWLGQVHARCDGSYLTRCFRRFPLQTSVAEVSKLKQLLTDQRFLFWPIASIAAYCRREGLLLLSDASWYKYAGLLGITRPGPESRRKKRKKGIRAKEPNEKWHADVSVFDIGQKRYYIYLVVDNFSRKVLSWKVSDKLSASIRVQTLREAYAYALTYWKDLNVDLIVDGGSENNNRVVDAFVSSSAINIHKLVALRDVHFSNSLVEAHFSLFKYNYLYRMPIGSFRELVKAMAFAVKDFDVLRPHGSLNGSTPAEAYVTGTLMPKNAHSEAFRVAKARRIAQNRMSSCVKCG